MLSFVLLITVILKRCEKWYLIVVLFVFTWWLMTQNIIIFMYMLPIAPLKLYLVQVLRITSLCCFVAIEFHRLPFPFHDWFLAVQSFLIFIQLYNTYLLFFVLFCVFGVISIISLSRPISWRQTSETSSRSFTALGPTLRSFTI